MAKKTDEKQKTEGELVRTLRGERSYRDFETYLNEKIPAGMPGFITFQSVWNWENHVHPVTGECLMAWMQFYSPDDPRHQLALDVFTLRMKSAHWVGGVDSALDARDGKRLLEAMKIKE
jgi:hypothetical protein